MRATEDVAEERALLAVEALHGRDCVPAKDTRKQRDDPERGEQLGTDPEFHHGCTTPTAGLRLRRSPGGKKGAHSFLSNQSGTSRKVARPPIERASRAHV